MFKSYLEGAGSYIQSYFESNGIIDISRMRKLRTTNEKGLIQY